MFCGHVWCDSACFVVMFGVTVHVLWSKFGVTVHALWSIFDVTVHVLWFMFGVTVCFVCSR